MARTKANQRGKVRRPPKAPKPAPKKAPKPAPKPAKKKPRSRKESQAEQLQRWSDRSPGLKEAQKVKKRGKRAELVRAGTSIQHWEFVVHMANSRNLYKWSIERGVFEHPGACDHCLEPYEEPTCRPHEELRARVQLEYRCAQVQG
uniref:Uncharacterized protein n=1 Tax=Eutreptiella gymnastica TaxID=73025 RepID=A0A7S1JF35_9EUGL|mmetsp:Transcript_88574/g.153795  ORF Transcript_88574/g.153795 Transcript_88574/m.153795 type:complete len:146 (+) Transcript_88574:226-663(+)